jgi:hypothetical protein
LSRRAAVAVALLLGGVVLVAALPRLLERALIAAAESQGWEAVALEVTSVRPWAVELASVRLGAAPVLEADRIVVGTDLGHLVRGRATRISVESGVLRGRYGADGVTLEVPGPDPGGPGARSEEAGPLLAPPPFDALALSEFRLALSGEDGPVTLVIPELELATARGAPVVARGRAWAEHGDRRLEARLDVGLDGDRLVGEARLHDGAGTLDATLRLVEPEDEAPGRFPTVEGLRALRARGELELTAERVDLAPLAPPLTGRARAEFELAEGVLEARVAPLRLGAAPDLAVERIELRADLAAARVETIALRGGVLHGRYGPDGVTLALPTSGGSGRGGDAGPGAPSALLPPPVAMLSVEDFRVALDGPDGPATVTVSSARLSAPADARLAVQAGIALALGRRSWTLDADLALDGTQLFGGGALRSASGSLDVRLELGATGSGPGHPPALSSWDALRAEGTVRIRAEDADLSPFVPSFGGEGSVSVALAEGRLRLASDDLDLTAFGLAAQDVDLRLALRDLESLRTPPRQTIEVARLVAGIDLGGGAARFQLVDGGTLELEALDWRLYGGTLHTEGRIDPAAESNRLTVAVDSLSLHELVGALGRDDLEVTGNLGGEITLRLEDGRIFADHGRLTAEEAGGVIRYRSGMAGASVQGLDLALRALEDFRYRTLRVEVGGEITGEMTLAIRVEGSNPEVYDGYPIQLNLNLEGPLAAVVQGSTTGFRVQDAVEKRFQERGEAR